MSRHRDTHERKERTPLLFSWTEQEHLRQRAAFHEDLAIPERCKVCRKGFRPQIDSYSAFFENDKTTATGLEAYLKGLGVTRVFVVGLAYDFCVRYTAEVRGVYIIRLHLTFFNMILWEKVPCRGWFQCCVVLQYKYHYTLTTRRNLSAR